MRALDQTQGNVVPGRITVLDGWRGISILLVIFGHVVCYLAVGSTTVLQQELGDVLATLGVCIFFTISGLIISTLALREQQSSGHMSVSHFYVRRALRILPPFYLYLLAMIFLTAQSYIVQPEKQTLEAAAFMCDLRGADCGWFAGHSWSLAYEEQFYLLFPLSFLLLRNYRLVGFSILFVVMLSVPVVRLLLDLGPPWHAISHAAFNLSFICAGVVVGSLGERIKQLWQRSGIQTIIWSATILLTVVALLDVASHLHRHSGRLLHVRMLVVPTLEPVCVVLLVVGSIYAAGRLQKVLNVWVLQFI